MKNILTGFVLSALLLFSCAGSGSTPEKSERLAMAYKKEGDVFQSQGNYSAALAKLLEAEKILPDNSRLQNSLGLAYMGKQRYDLAESAFKKALRLEPGFTEAKNNLGAVYLRQEKWDTAIDQFERVLKNLVYPTPQFPLVNIGWAYLGKKDYPKAQAFFRKAEEESPGFITAVHGQAQVFLQTGQIDRAMSFLHRHLHKTPDAAILHADLANVYEKKGQLRQAKHSWQLVLKLTPENSGLHRDARDRLDRLIY